MKHHIYTITIIIILILLPFVSSYGQWQKYYIDDNLSGADWISIADINLDGKLDIVVTAEMANDVVWYENKFPIWEKHIIDPNLELVIGVATADIDGDDTIDVVAAGRGANDVVWYENNYPNWTKHIIDNNFIDAHVPTVGDLNNDGRIDIVVHGYTYSQIAWYENDHPVWNKFIIEESAAGKKVPQAMIDDIDNDGILDIVATRGNSLIAYKTKDNGLTWEVYPIDDNLIGAWHWYCSDVDNDNVLDIVATGGGIYNVGDGLYWYKYDGSTWIKNPMDSEAKNYVCAFDYDSDGKKDIATTDNSNITVYKNNFPNEWERTVIDSNLGLQWYILPTDIDGDDADDLIVSSWSSNDLVWYKNLYNIAHVTSLNISRKFLHPQDTLIINTQMVNLENHLTEVYAIVKGDKETFNDSLELFDDGVHGDYDPSDNIWGEEWLVNIPVDMYSVSLFVNDLTANSTYAPPFESRFTTKGPIAFEKLVLTDLDPIPNPGDRVKFSITLKNLGNTDTVYNVEAKIIISDSLIRNATTGKPLFGDIGPGESLTNSSRDFGLVFKNFGDSASVGSYEFGLEISSNGETFWYDTFTIDVLTGMEDISTNLPTEFNLNQNYPNPFNPSTIIKYSIPKQSNVTLKVFDVLGGEVAILVNREQPQGDYEIEFNGSELTSGIYFYRLRAGDYVETKKMILLK